MVEVVRATKSEPLGFVNRLSLSHVLPYGLPVLMVLVIAISVTLTIQRAGVLRTWSEVYSGTGSFLVESCDARQGMGADQWSCHGHLTTGGTVDGDSELTTSLGAVASARPYVGQNIDVFFDQDDRSTVYPVQYRLNELSRAYLSLLPRLLLLVGSVIWLAGWLLTRKLDPEDYVARDAVRIPQRFTWRARGWSWIGAAAVVLVLNHVLATRVIGSLAIV